MATADKRVMTEATGQAIVTELRKIPGVTNPLPVAKGGTGLTSLDDLKEALHVQEKFDIDVEEELGKRVRSVNSVEPDENGNVQLLHVATADNLASDDAQVVSGTFVERTTAGDASISDGSAYLGVVYGSSVRNGYSPESMNYEVLLAVRIDDAIPISADINWNTYKAAVNNVSTNKTFTYTTSWSENPATYGLTVTGTPVSGDVINVYYVTENRGTIVNSTPLSLCESNWNLYDSTTGYARVIKYSDTHGFKIGGTYTEVSFSTTVSGTQTVVTPDANGLFTIPESGYVFVTGGNDTDTYVLMTWSDWTDGYSGSFLANDVDEIDFSSVMQESFPFGLCAIGTAMDEINFSDKIAYVRIERTAYSNENLIVAKNSGRAYTYDTNWIYSVKETPDRVRFNIENQITVYDHGTEYFTGTVVPPVAFILYGQNLRDKLRTDVVTISSQSLTSAQQAQVRTNIGAASSEVESRIADISYMSNLLYGPGINIPEGSDIDEYKTPGRYRVQSGAIAGTITNGPVSGMGYLLIVEQTVSANRFMQRAYANSSASLQYCRTYTGSWSVWKKVQYETT